MKKILFVLAAFCFIMFADSSSAQDKVNQKKETAPVKTEEAGKPVNTICPVSTEDIDEQITYEYKGKTYALCCKSCLKKFKNDPEKYISRLSDDGKSIKKKETK